MPTMQTDKTMTLDGIEYKLVPIEELKEAYITTVKFYYGCDSDCGRFQFAVFLNDDGEIDQNTQSVSYFPNGLSNKSNVEILDNVDFLRNVLEDKKVHEYSSSEISIDPDDEYNLVNLLQLVHEKGWL